MSAVEQFKNFISRTNLRMTRERESVIRAVFETPDHFTVSGLAKRLSSDNKKIARSTVYRLIPHLLEAGLIRKAPHSGEIEDQVYEPVHGRLHHDHLICEHCGQVIEFKENAIEILQKKVAEQYGYKLKKHHLELRGVCLSCQDKIVEKAIKPW